MDFRFTEEEERFRQEVRAFLKAELPPEGTDIISSEDVLEKDELWLLSRRMALRLGEKGWLALVWPKEYGGQGKPYLDQVVFAEEMAYHRAPGVDIIGVRMVGPTLITCGSTEQKKKHLAAIGKGETTWCQGFSEPGAGSDLASVQTKAVEGINGFLVQGQKTWTSGAHRAEWCILLARTDPSAPKHRGLSLFLVNMKSPGVSVRPLLNILGGHSFNEVFFDGVQVPRENLVGEKNAGWQVAMTLVSFERSLLWVERAAGARRLLEDMVALVQKGNAGKAKNPLLRHRLAEAALDIEIARLLAYRAAWMQSKGLIPEMETAMGKVYGSEMLQRVGQVGMELQGLYGDLTGESSRSLLGGMVGRWHLNSLGRTLAGGTSEVQRNIIALRGLGLPRG